MTLNKKSWHFKLFSFAYGYEPNDVKDGCFYIRRMIFAVLTFPLYIIGSLYLQYLGAFDSITESKCRHTSDWLSRVGSSVLVCVVIFTGCLIGVGVITGILERVYGGVADHHWVWVWLASPIVSIITLFLLFGGIALIAFIITTISDSRNGIEKEPKPLEERSFIVQSYVAYKEKHCPVIKWEGKSKLEKEYE